MVEDDYDGEFRYVGHPLPAPKSLDGRDRVLYAGSFSKVLFPGLRLGYLILPEVLLAAFADTIRSGRGGDVSSDDAALTNFDFAIDFVPEAYGADLERHPCLQRLVAAKAARLDRLANGTFDFTLRCDADYLEKLADGHVEPIFVHARLLPWPERDDRIGPRIQPTVVRIVGVIRGPVCHIAEPAV